MSVANADVDITSTGGGNAFGRTVSNAGDLNYDGYADLLIGARNMGATAEGQVFVILGQNAMAATFNGGTSAEIAITGEAMSDRFGTSHAFLGDFDGDAVADIGVGAPLYDEMNGAIGATDSADRGRFYLYYGAMAGAIAAGDAQSAWAATEAGSTALDFTTDGVASGAEYFGYGCSGIGDYDNDGNDDFIISAPYSDSLTAMVDDDNGQVVVVVGTGAAFGATETTMGIGYDIINGEATDDWLGASVSWAGDLDGDAMYDITFCAVGQDPVASDEGRAYVVLGDGGGGATYSAGAATTLKTDGTIGNGFFGPTGEGLVPDF